MKAVLYRHLIQSQLLLLLRRGKKTSDLSLVHMWTGIINRLDNQCIAMLKDGHLPPPIIRMGFLRKVGEVWIKKIRNDTVLFHSIMVKLISLLHTKRGGSAPIVFNNAVVMNDENE